MNCNIDKTDCINRTVIGILICLAAWAGLGKYFFMLIGAILIIEGLIGWGYIPTLINKIKNHE